MHMLLLGDPGCGKSQLLKAASTIAPRSTYASGKGMSEAGMTAAAVRDDFGDTEWGLEAGALVLADKGVACVDEIDKADDDALSSLHTALEDQQVHINKAGINTSLPARTSLLAAGNPKYGRFDRFEPIAEQIDLDPPLLSRFDLMFMLKDQPDKEDDAELAEHIIETRATANAFTYSDGETDVDISSIKPTVPAEVLRAYIAYAKQNVHPCVRKGQKKRLVDWYVNLRQANGEEDGPVPVTARKVEALCRLAEASAKTRLSENITDEDMKRAGSLVMEAMKDVGTDPETGNFDVDVVEAGTSKSQRDRMKNLQQIIDDLADEWDSGAPVDVVIDKAMDLDMDRDKAEHEIQKLKDKGEVYEPKSGHLRTT
jgi:replicative DNA helicase Mcm